MTSTKPAKVHNKQFNGSQLTNKGSQKRNIAFPMGPLTSKSALGNTTNSLYKGSRDLEAITQTYDLVTELKA